MRASLVCLLGSILACSSDPAATSTPAPDANPPSVSIETCTARCSAKAAACGAPAAQAGLACAQLCTEPVTEAQATCLEGAACRDLVTAALQPDPLGTICPGLASAAPREPGTPPPVLTITGVLPAGTTATHTTAGAMLSSIVNVATVGIVTPPLPAGRVARMTDDAVEATVVSPPRNGCESKINVSVSPSQLTVSSSGVDLPPDRRCADFLDAIAAQGITITLRNVPWDGAPEISTVTVALRRPR